MATALVATVVVVHRCTIVVVVVVHRDTTVHQGTTTAHASLQQRLQRRW